MIEKLQKEMHEYIAASTAVEKLKPKQVRLEMVNPEQAGKECVIFYPEHNKVRIQDRCHICIEITPRQAENIWQMLSVLFGGELKYEPETVKVEKW